MIKLLNLYKRLIYRLLRYRNLDFNGRLSTENPIARKLQKDGIAILSWKDVFGESHLDSSLFKTLEAEALGKFQTYSESNRSKELKSVYLKKAYKVGESIDSSTALIRLTTYSGISDIVQNFFGNGYRLQAADYWLSKTSIDSPRVASQLWHTDPEDTILLKLFVYLTDVDRSNGATAFL